MFKKIKNKIFSRTKNIETDLKLKFKKIFSQNLFNGKVSVSGPGSDLIQTRIIIQEIPKIIKKYNISSMLDAPCGDFFWMKNVDLKDINYIGCDIVEELIKSNNFKFSNDRVSFKTLDIVNEILPDADLIFCRDCFVHLTNNQIAKAINNFRKSKSKFLLTTTFPGKSKNTDLHQNIWRPINLQHPPFNFPEPIELINEGCTEDNGIHSDKSIGLWRIDALKQGLGNG